MTGPDNENYGRQLLRVVGDLHFQVANVAGESDWSVALVVLDTDQVIATTFPDMDTDLHPWLWLKSFHFHVPAVDATASPSRGMSVAVDIRTSRKLAAHSQVGFLCESHVMAGNLTWDVLVRLLLTD